LENNRDKEVIPVLRRVDRVQDAVADLDAAEETAAEIFGARPPRGRR